MSGFENGVALITGAGSGLGRGIVLELVRCNCTRIIAADISVPGLAETASQAAEINSSVKILQIKTDVTDVTSVEDMVKQGVKEFGRIDYSIHCAGVAGDLEKKTDEQSVENYDFVMGVNIRGVFLTERAVLKVMKGQEPRKMANGMLSRGSIVNMGSILGLSTMSGISPYIMAKHGVTGLTKVDALDYAQDHIRVNAVCPGFVETGLATPEIWRGIEATVVQGSPMKRFGLIEEVVHAVLFLAGDKASFITGVTLPVDGGHVCHFK